MPKTSSCVESGLEFGSPGLSTALQTRHTAAQPLTLPLQPFATFWNVCPSHPPGGPAVTLWLLLLAIRVLSNSPPTSTKHTHVHTQTYTRWILLYLRSLYRSVSAKGGHEWSVCFTGDLQLPTLPTSLLHRDLTDSVSLPQR